jgi:transcription initiation factor TFIIIB Brf1 subunit/transcription initiation factor TFIIB
MTYFIGHHPCNKCGSSDANAEYSDGSFFCWSCHWVIPAKTTLQSVTKYRDKTDGKVTKDLQDLPYDVTPIISGEPLKWLRKYHLTNENIFKNNILWSQSQQMLIYPYYGDGNLLCWQGRFFPERKPKSHTEGYPENHLLLHYSNNSNGSVCVVEDTISGIKVSDVVDTCVLWGSNLSNQKARRLSKLYDHLILWLDGDKTKEMIKFQTRYGWMFKSCKVISTIKDPKEYSHEEINGYINPT